MTYEEQYAEIVSNNNNTQEYISAEREARSFKRFTLLEDEDIRYGYVEYDRNAYNPMNRF